MSSRHVAPVDDHFTQGKNIVAGIEAAIGARLTKSTVDRRGRIDLIPEPVDESQSCTACQSVVSAFKLQSRRGSPEEIRSPNG